MRDELRAPPEHVFAEAAPPALSRVSADLVHGPRGLRAEFDVARRAFVGVGVVEDGRPESGAGESASPAEGLGDVLPQSLVLLQEVLPSLGQGEFHLVGIFEVDLSGSRRR